MLLSAAVVIHSIRSFVSVSESGLDNGEVNIDASTLVSFSMYRFLVAHPEVSIEYGLVVVLQSSM